MKFQFAVVALLPILLLAAGPESPIKKVVLFIKELKEDLNADKEVEQKAYDKYVDWCKETTDTANKEIGEAKAIIDEQTAIIEKMSGKGGASGAEIEYLKKSIVENEKSVKEAQTIRSKEKAKFDEVKEDLESGLASMKAMMDSLDNPANAVKVSFLSTDSGSHQAHLRNVVAKALKMPAIASKLSTEKMRSLRNFADGEAGLLQMQSGDAPDSNLGGIMNVIQQTMEDYQGDLDAANKEEDEKVAAYKTLLKNLADELANMEQTLAEQEATNGDSAKALADAKMLREETTTEMKADEKLLVETQDACKLKKDQFEARKKLREEEIAGVDKALEILESQKEKFASAATVSFLQISSDENISRDRAYASVKALATKYKSLSLAHLAISIQRGHFDKVIDVVDKQIEHLKAEEQTDEDHRDRCQKQLSDNAKLITELTHTSDKAGVKIDRLTEERDGVQADFNVLRKEMEESQKEIKEREEVRSEEREAHLVALQHDKDALAILKEAIVAITAFYKNNKIEISLAETNGKPKKAPDAGFSDKDYKGDREATSGLLSLMNMVQEEMENEIKNSQKADADAQDQYQQDYTAMKNKFDSQEAMSVSTGKTLADLQERISDKSDFKAETDSSNDAAKKDKATLESDCEWVKTRFDSRRQRRQAEIEGLTEAKGLLAKGGVR
eukprot:TRINITY_DN4431_c0_g3_i1.p1 TRINITY_DN4431_c0_g3~~TRINITY_DN4431_c0_g3_i1.p1  ORF type:complete len:675 (+),score=227.40 TRINITY_DN4431_c0_g3_i1:43-2067(+)